MAKIVYQDCVVLKMLRWKDDHFIITLLGKQWCVFNAIWALPKAKKTRKHLHPELFQNLQATLQIHPDGLHRLRDYRELPSPDVRNLEIYNSLNFLARYFILNCEEAPDPAPWHIWQRFQKQTSSSVELSLNLLAELCYHNGTWPAGDYCEGCNAPLYGKAWFDSKALLCQNCQDSGTPCSNSSLHWIQNRFLHAHLQAPDIQDLKKLLFWLKNRLPDHTFRDRIIRKLWQTHQHHLFSPS